MPNELLLMLLVSPRHIFNILCFYLRFLDIWVWRDDSAVRRYTALVGDWDSVLDIQYLCWAIHIAHNSSSRVPDALSWYPWIPAMIIHTYPHAEIHMYTQNLQIKAKEPGFALNPSTWKTQAGRSLLVGG